MDTEIFGQWLIKLAINQIKVIVKSTGRVTQWCNLQSSVILPGTIRLLFALSLA